MNQAVLRPQNISENHGENRRPLPIAMSGVYLTDIQWKRWSLLFQEVIASAPGGPATCCALSLATFCRGLAKVRAHQTIELRTEQDRAKND